MLPAGVAGLRLRYWDHDEVQVSVDVPDDRVQMLVRHLLNGHGGVAFADAFRVITCDPACSLSTAALWQPYEQAGIG